jgi:hypothetical protein
VTSRALANKTAPFPAAWLPIRFPKPPVNGRFAPKPLILFIRRPAYPLSLRQRPSDFTRHSQGRPRPGPRPTTSANSAAASLTRRYSSGCHFDFRGQVLSTRSVVRTVSPARATKAFQTRSRTRPRHTRFVIRPPRWGCSQGWLGQVGRGPNTLEGEGWRNIPPGVWPSYARPGAAPLAI